MKYRTKQIEAEVERVSGSTNLVRLNNFYYSSREFFDAFFEPVETSDFITKDDIKTRIGWNIVAEPKIKFRTFHVIEEGVDEISQWERELGRITVAFQITGKNAAIAQFSYCSARDTYSKKYGQLIARDRLQHSP